ncbi:cupin domain-containing protein [Sphingomonas jaspsi]|uniref:cupin domain-containing protein n=1 Tax=Sphingomonas jaspsi TaxID=392409 RepID=UPI0004B9CDD5|nr:cupin domain-containing protein [Sphingomonas jaspsi]
MPKVDLESVEASNATGYPPPFDEPVQGRWWKRIAPLAGLTELGASHVVLKPGAWSSQRHWHEAEDELVVMISGEAVLVEDGGETLLRAGDVAAWKAGATDGHHMINRGQDDCVFIAISAGNRAGGGSYSDIDMKFEDAGYFHKDGTPYPAKRLP